MTCWVVIPVKPPPGRKSRLAPRLDESGREALVREMAAHVARTAAAAPSVDETAFIAASDLGLPVGAQRLRDPGGGLNAAAAEALAQVTARGARRLIFIAADLPLVSAGDFERLANVGADVVAIAPDRHGTGTNAIALPIPAAADFRFLYGINSFDKHFAEAQKLGLKVDVVRSPGLSRDVDEPADLADTANLIGAARCQQVRGE